MNKFLIGALITILVLAFIEVNQCHSINYGSSGHGHRHGSVRNGQGTNELSGHRYHRQRHGRHQFNRDRHCRYGSGGDVANCTRRHDAEGLDDVGGHEHGVVEHVQVGHKTDLYKHEHGQGGRRYGRRRGSNFTREPDAGNMNHDHDAEDLNHAGSHGHRRRGRGRGHRHHGGYTNCRHENVTHGHGEHGTGKQSANYTGLDSGVGQDHVEVFGVGVIEPRLL